MINDFANNFTDILRVKGITQKQIAQLLNVRPSTVNQWTKGKREPELDLLLRICYHLETTPDELLGYTKVQNLLEIEQTYLNVIQDFDNKSKEEQNAIITTWWNTLNK